MDFMAAAIEGKDDEQFPSANAPKKVLNVDQTPSDDDSKMPADDSDTDNGDAASPDGKAVPEGGNSASPLSAPSIPVAPAVPAPPASGPVIVPAKLVTPKTSPPAA
jgi:hypothetical protein